MTQPAQALLRPLAEAWVHCRRHRREVGRFPNPVVPRTFNERVSDTLERRAVVRERRGEDPCGPLLGVWESHQGLARD